MVVLGYLPELKRGLGLAFCAHFLHVFFHKNNLYLMLYQWAEFQCHTFFRSLNMKQNCYQVLI